MFMDHVKFVCGMISSTSSCCEILRIFHVEQVEVVCVCPCVVVADVNFVVFFNSSVLAVFQ